MTLNEAKAALEERARHWKTNTETPITKFGMNVNEARLKEVERALELLNQIDGVPSLAPDLGPDPGQDVLPFDLGV